MEIAYSVAKLSYAERRKVGAVIVKDNQIVSFGYNGTPHDFENECEETITRSVDNPGHKEILEGKGYTCDDHTCSKVVTKGEVLHAESNALSKIAKSTLSSDGATLYTTTSPYKADVFIGPEGGIDLINEFLQAYYEDPTQDFSKITSKYK